MRSFLFRAVAVCVFFTASVAAFGAKTWTGSAGSSWSNPANWSPQAAPVAGEPLVFPFGTYMVNDLAPGFAVGALTFQGGTVSLAGNQLTLMGDVTFDPASSFTLSCTAPLKIGAAVTINGGWNSTYDTIDVNGQTLTFSSVHPVAIKTLSGAGTVNAGGQGVQINGSGSFSGTLTGVWNVNLSLTDAGIPDANFNATTLTGVGTTGNVVAANLMPGWNNPGGADLHNVGYLRTKSLTITHQYAVDLTYFAQDAALVTGTVTITGATLAVSLPNGYPPAGTPLTIISNDGTDPVVGTFNGLPEGTNFSVNGTTFTISYHGGDGNDVTLTAQGTTKTWVGAPLISSPGAHWSYAGAWLPQAIPVAGEPLLFADQATSMVNDLPSGFAVGDLDFQGGTPGISGNALTLMGNLKFELHVSQFSCSVPLTIGNSITFGEAQSSVFSGPIDVNGKTLMVNANHTVFSGPINGSGSIHVSGPGAQLSGGGTFTGSIEGSVDVSGSIPNADINAPYLTGNGSAGRVTAQILRPGTATVPSNLDPHTFGVLQTKGLTLSSIGSFDVDVSATASDAVHVAGAVTLAGLLNVTVTGAPPAFGQTFVIIDNDGTDPVNGTFTNLPAGSTVHAGNSLFRIFYNGGDGNDVMLIAAAQPEVAVTPVKPSTVIGEKATFTASVASQFGTPAGTVAFAADGSPIGTAVLSNGTASIDISLLSVGDHQITASFLGAGPYAAADSAPATLHVNRGETSTTLQALDHPVYGASKFTAGVSLKPPASAPLIGSVTIRENGKDVTGTTPSNAAIIAIPTLRAGLHTLVASYSGSSSLLGSDSLPLIVVVDPAPAQLVASSDGNALTITALPTNGVPDQPSGTVTVAESGNTIAQTSINGTATLHLTLPPGTHSLTISYSGDANFAPDTIVYVLTVPGGETPPTRHRGVRH